MHTRTPARQVANPEVPYLLELVANVPQLCTEDRKESVLTDTDVAAAVKKVSALSLYSPVSLCVGVLKLPLLR
jgi:hypothetical protein